MPAVARKNVVSAWLATQAQKRAAMKIKYREHIERRCAKYQAEQQVTVDRVIVRATALLCDCATALLWAIRFWI